MEAIMLNLSVFSHNHHPSGVNLLAKYIRRGIQAIPRMVEPQRESGRQDWV